MSIQNNYLVPTDFSDNAFTALTFAIELAKKQNAHVRILHIHQANENLESYNETELKIQTLIQDIKATHSDISISGSTIEGPFLPTLLEHEKNHNYQAIIMGTNGVTGFKKLWLGTNTFNTIEKSKHPVWAIPLEFDTHIPKNIGLLTNFIPEEIEILKNFTSTYGKDFNLNLLHVREINEKPYAHKEIWKEYFTSIMGENNVEIHEDTTSKRLDIADKPSDCVRDFILDLKLDALILRYVPKSFFNNLLGKNVGKNLSQDQKIPICFFK